MNSSWCRSWCDLLASAGNDEIVRLWNPTNQIPAGELTGHTGPVRALAAVPGPDGRTLLASAGEGQVVRLWDPTNRTRVAELTDHTGEVRALAAVPGPDGRTLLASAGFDRVVRLWDPTNRTLIGKLTGHTAPVRALAAFPGPDGRTLLTSTGFDRVVRLWSLQRGRRVRFLGADDAPSLVDLVGRGPLVDVLVDLTGAGGHTVRPTVVSVEGRWGSGKTSVLRQLRDRLNPAASGADAGAGDAAEQTEARPRSVSMGGARRGGGSSVSPLTVRSAARLLKPARSPRRAPGSVTQAAPVIQAGSGGLAVAWFNPWAHQSADQVWAGLTAAMLEAAGPFLHGDPDSEAGARARQRYWFTSNLRRVDRGALRRLLWTRLRSPLLAIGVVAGLVPLVTAVATRTTATVDLFGWRPPAALVAAVLPALLLLAGVVHTGWRYARGAAASYLPGVLFEGPVLSGALGQPGTAGEVGVHDPLYRSRSGYLYLVQHDIRAVLEDLRNEGVELVVFIDDLDRCTPATTAQVLEAINLFLSGEFPGARFILGLDPEVVAAHIDHTYAELLDTPTAPGDPTPGWTFLRKLVQLPVMLPAVTDDGLDQLVDDILSPAEQPSSRPAVDQPAEMPAADPGADRPSAPGDRRERSGDEPPSAETAGGPTAAAERDDVGGAPAGSEPDHAAGQVRQADAAAAAASERTDALLAALEREPAVRSRIQERVRLLPDRSARDVKRLLTIWQFYVRVLDRIDPARTEAALIQRARQLVLVAEIITRWPAHQTALRRLHPSPTGEPERGLQLLAATAADDTAWTATTRIVLPDPPAGLRELLRDHDGAAVAALYASVT